MQCKVEWPGDKSHMAGTQPVGRTTTQWMVWCKRKLFFFFSLHSCKTNIQWVFFLMLTITSIDDKDTTVLTA